MGSRRGTFLTALLAGALAALPRWAGAACSTVAGTTCAAGQCIGVNSGGGEDFTTLSAAVDSLVGASLTADKCIIIYAGGTYGGAYVRGITTNDFRLRILGAPATRPTINNAAAINAAFNIDNASVTLSNLLIDGAGPAVQYGILGTSTRLAIDNVYVNNAGGFFTGSAISVSTLAVISNSTVTTNSGHAVKLAGSSATISASSFTVTAGASEALVINGSSNVVSGSSFLSMASTAAAVGGHYTIISKSSMTSFSAEGAALWVTNDDAQNPIGVLVSQSYMSAAGGSAAYLENTSSAAIVQSTMTVTAGAAGTAALVMADGASSNTVSNSLMTSLTASALVFRNQAVLNFVSYSSMTTAATGNSAALFDAGAASNTVNHSFIHGVANAAITMSGGANRNAIDRSTVTTQSNVDAVFITQASTNVFNESYIANRHPTSGNVIRFDTAVTSNAVVRSVLSLRGAGIVAKFATASSVTVRNSLLTAEGGSAGTGVEMSLGSFLNVIDGSTISAPGAFRPVDLLANGVSSNTFSRNRINTASTGEPAVLVLNSYNVFSQNYITANREGIRVEIPGSGIIISQNEITSQQSNAVKISPFSSLNRISSGTAVSNATDLSDAVFILDATSNIVKGVSATGNTGAGVAIVGGFANRVSYSTITAGSPGTAALVVRQADYTKIEDSVVSASTAVAIFKAQTELVRNRLTATNATLGAALAVDDSHLDVASNTISGGKVGLILTGNLGSQTLIGHNDFQPTALTAISIGGTGSSILLQGVLYISSNTIQTKLDAAVQTYGLRLNGLTSGATIAHNSFVFRKSGAANTALALAISGTSGTKILVTNNRFSNPGVITSGEFLGIDVVGSNGVDILFNDFHSTGPARFLFIGAVNSASNIAIRSNIFSSSGTGPASSVFDIAANSQSGFDSNYNNFFSSNGLNNVVNWGGSIFGLPSPWKTMIGFDQGSNAVHPRWINPGSGVEDFHPQSQAGRFQNGTFVNDAGTSQTIDAGYPLAAVGMEPAPNGGRVNQGSYGQSAEASKSVTRLQVLLPGQTAAPGTLSGVTGPISISTGVPFNVLVNATDVNWNIIPGALGSEPVRLSTSAAQAGSFPFDITMGLQGSGIATGMVFNAPIAVQTITAGTIGTVSALSYVTPAFSVFAQNFSSPTASISIANGSVRSTLSGAISGTAADAVAVSGVSVAIQRKDPAGGLGRFFDWKTGTFQGASGLGAVYTTATMSNPNGLSTNWSVAFADINLQNQASYFILAFATNTSGNVTVPVAETTFTFNTGGLTSGSAGDGQGSLAANADSLFGCQPIVLLATFTVGAAGIGPGGAIAIHVPDGWSRPLSSQVPAALVGVGGYNPCPGAGCTQDIGVVQIKRLNVPDVLNLNPASLGNSPLGDNWMTYVPGTPLAPGSSIILSYKGFPPAGQQGTGPQFITASSKGGSGGNLVAIGGAGTSINLFANRASGLRFVPPDPITMGSLQTSPTMQIEITDQCGVSTATPTGVVIDISAGQLGTSLDANATFYFTGGAALGTQITIAGGANLSPAFYFKTSTTAASEFLKAFALFPAGAAPLPPAPSRFGAAGRFVQLISGNVGLTQVSVDTGTFIATAKSATMTAYGFAAPAVINFNLSDPSLRWEVIISSDPVNFFPELVHRAGQGDPGRSITWTGLNEVAYPQRFVPPGPYFVKIQLEGGVFTDKSLQITLPQASSIYGTVNSTGASAFVIAEGRGASYGNFAVASSTGFFQIFGLVPGNVYNVEASTGVVLDGKFLKLTTAAAGVAAVAGGVDVGTIPFPTPSTLRVSVALPVPANRDLFGRIFVHTADYSRSFFGGVHFASGTTSSDDGGQSFGVAAGTWTVVPLSAGTYDIEVEIPEIRMSTTVKSVVIGPGERSDQTISLAKKANVYGFVVIPSTRAFGAPVSLEALQKGKTVPSIFAGAFIPGPSGFSSRYALFGLDAGSWTVTARSQGFTPSSATVFISTGVDLGTLAAGGVDLYLGTGSVIVGTITVIGNTQSLGQLGGGGPGGQGFDLFLNAFNPATFSRSGQRVRLPNNAALTITTYTLAGLEDGIQQLSIQAPGFTEVKASVTLSGKAEVNFVLKAVDARAAFTVKLPGVGLAASEFRRVALLVRGPQTLLKQDIVGPSTVTYFSSSATIFSEPFNPGIYRFDAFDPKTGVFRSLNAGLQHGGTTQILFDLTGSTATVSGTVSLSGSVSYSSNAYSVTISSIGGLVANASFANYCLLGNPLPLTTTTAHVELIPIDPQTGFLSGPIKTSSSPTTGCNNLSDFLPPNVPIPFHAYLAPLNADGTFTFTNVPHGSYYLRNNWEIDGQTSNGDELPRFRKQIQVEGNVTGLELKLDSARTVSGTLVLPPQTTANRSFQVALLDNFGKVVRATVVNVNGVNAAPFKFEKVTDGSYVMRTGDLGFPKLYAGKPVLVKVQGDDVENLRVDLLPSGVIKGKIAVQTVLPNGTTGPFLLVTALNKNLLPRAFSIFARANPWFIGGYASAQGDRCSPEGECGTVLIDPTGQFTIDGLLPGFYDVNFRGSYSGDDSQEGGVSVIGGFVTGAAVAEGQLVDVGVVSLTAATELRGRVFDASTSSAAPNILITARPSKSRVPSRDDVRVLTDKNGDYVLSGLDPRVRFYDVVAAARKDREAAGSEASPYEQFFAKGVDLSSISILNFRIQPAPHSISGRLVTPAGGPRLRNSLTDGQAQPGAVIFLQKNGVVPTNTPIADVIAFTDPDGRFKITALTTGTYKFVASSLDYGSLGRSVTLTTGPVNLGDIQLSLGATLSGNLRKLDGSAPSENEVSKVFAGNKDLTELLLGSVERDPVTRTITAYSISGFRVGPSTGPIGYNVALFDHSGRALFPEEAKGIVFKSTEPQTLDIVYRPPKPSVFAKGKKEGSVFKVQFEAGQPLRSKTADDSRLDVILGTKTAAGGLTDYVLSGDRTKLEATYTPGASESSFTLRFDAYTSVADPESIDPVNPEYRLSTVATFYIGIDGLDTNDVGQIGGGNLLVDGDAGRITLPNGAFAVDASSSVNVTFKVSKETLAGVQTAGIRFRTQEQANEAALRYPKTAYPANIFKALAATPPTVSPFSGFYDVLLPLGIRTALQNPVPMTISYSSSTDPTTLNLYWYNEAANAYILQQDVTGAAPVIDTENRTITINVNHFSTFVLFQTGVNVITGDAFAGGEIEAFNFPNPFDLSIKTVNLIHPAQNQLVRGTMIRFSLPAGISGDASIRIFNTAGERVRTIQMGTLAASAHYYQGWDGRNDSGRDVGSGVYIGQIKVGGQSKYFKMALIK